MAKFKIYLTFKELSSGPRKAEWFPLSKSDISSPDRESTEKQINPETKYFIVFIRLPCTQLKPRVNGSYLLCDERQFTTLNDA